MTGAPKAMDRTTKVVLRSRRTTFVAARRNAKVAPRCTRGWMSWLRWRRASISSLVNSETVSIRVRMNAAGSMK